MEGNDEPWQAPECVESSEAVDHPVSGGPKGVERVVDIVARNAPIIPGGTQQLIDPSLPGQALEKGHHVVGLFLDAPNASGPLLSAALWLTAVVAAPL